MIAYTKFIKISQWDDFSYSIAFELESGKVAKVQSIEFSDFGKSPKLKFNEDGMLVEINTNGEALFLSELRMKEYREQALEQMAEFKKEHLP